MPKRAPVAHQPILAEHVPVARVEPNPNNVRRDLGDLDELAESIARHGIIEPLVGHTIGRAKPPKIRLIAGHRRLAAAKAAGLDDVPIIIRTEPGRAELFELMLAENNQRAPLDPIAEAVALDVIRSDTGHTIDQIAAAVNRSSGWVSDRLRLLDLPDTVQERVRAGTTTITAAGQLAAALDAGDIDDDQAAELAAATPAALAGALAGAADKRAIAEFLTEVERAWPGRPIVTDSVWQIGDNSTFGAARYGHRPGEINRLAEMDDPATQVVAATLYNRDVTVYHVAPELLEEEDFVARTTPVRAAQDALKWVDLTNDDLADIAPVAALPAKDGSELWQRRMWHTHCPQHTQLVVPWSATPIDVCALADIHDDGDWTALASIHDAARSTGTMSAPRVAPRARFGADIEAAVFQPIAGVVAGKLSVGLLTAITDGLSVTATTSDNGDITFAADLDSLADIIAAGLEWAVDNLSRTPVEGRLERCTEELAVAHWFARVLDTQQLDIPDTVAAAMALTDDQDDTDGPADTGGQAST